MSFDRFAVLFDRLPLGVAPGDEFAELRAKLA
jgi:hypothetical protein